VTTAISRPHVGHGRFGRGRPRSSSHVGGLMDGMVAVPTRSRLHSPAQRPQPTARAVSRSAPEENTHEAPDYHVRFSGGVFGGMREDGHG
jgi:hypothetical protein